MPYADKRLPLKSFVPPHPQVILHSPVFKEYGKGASNFLLQGKKYLYEKKYLDGNYSPVINIFLYRL